MDTQKLQGASHEQGGVPIEAEGGERIFSVNDTNKIESLAKGNKFQKLGQFIKNAMGKQDSRPLDYKGMAEHGAKMFDSVDNKLPFNLSEKEHGILNQYAVYNNSVTPDMLNTNVAKTIMAKMGVKAPAPPIDYQSAYQLAVDAGVKFPAAVAAQWQLESASGKQTAAKNNFFGIKYDQGAVDRLKKLGYDIGKGAKVKDKQTGSFDHYMEFDNPSAAFAAYQGFIETNPRYKKALAASTAEDYIKEIKAAGYAQDPKYVNKLLGIIPTSVKNDQSAMGVNTGYIPSNFSTQAGTQANKPFAFEDDPNAEAIMGVDNEGIDEDYLNKIKENSNNKKLISLEKDTIESAEKNIKKQETLLSGIDDKIESKKGQIEKIKGNEYLSNPEKRKKIDKIEASIKEDWKSHSQIRTDIQNQKKKRNRASYTILNNELKSKEGEFNKLKEYLKTTYNKPFVYNGKELNREEASKLYDEYKNFKEKINVEKSGQIRAGVITTSTGTFNSPGETSDALYDFLKEKTKTFTIKPSAKPLPKIATGQAPANITTPPIPTIGVTSAAASAAATTASKDSKQDVIDKINQWDPEKNITGEATTTYDDLFADDRTSGQKTKDFLLNNAMNIAEVIGGIAGASKNLPRFMIPDQLIEQAREINQRAQTGLTAEEKSLMVRDAVEKEQTAYNFLGGSGLSSGQMLGIAPQLQRQTQDQKLKIDILDEQTREKYEEKSTNMEKYLSDLQYKTQFIPDYQEAQMDRQGAAMMAQSGMQGVQENLMYQKQFGKGTAYSAIQQATTKNIVEEIRAKEMAQSKGIKEADYLDSLDMQRKQAIQGITNMPQIDYDKFDISNINKIIEQFNR